MVNLAFHEGKISAGEIQEGCERPFQGYFNSPLDHHNILDPADVLGDDYPNEIFRVLKNKELREHGAYRNRRLILDASYLIETGELT